MYLAISDIEIGNIPIVFPPIKYSDVVFCFLLAKNAKYTPIKDDKSNIAPNTT